MEKQPPPFKVIIIGGSIVGLTLAHCLDHAGIDYVVLEKHQDVDPQLGAFIAILPNGARILEQLGLYDAVKEVSEPTTVHYSVFPDGFISIDYWPTHMKERLGLSLLILTRQQLLSVLYNGLRNKSNIQLRKKVVEIRPLESGISVLTDDGDVYHGDLVAGADGVHSLTRSELWRIASKEGQEKTTLKDQSALLAEYSVLFGISTAVPGINPGEQITSYNDDLALFAFGGKDGTVGWCAVPKNDQKYMYPHVPRFTQDDAIATCESFREVPILRDAKFGDIWDRRVAFSKTSLEEGMLQTWSHGRIVCIGDSISKMSPNLAQGANAGIETAAGLANALHRLIQAKGPRQRRPSDSEVANALTQFVQKHFGRLKTINYVSYYGARYQARDGVIYRVLGRYICSHIRGLSLYIIMRLMAGSIVLEYMPLPESTRKQLDLLRTSKTMDSLNLTVILILAMIVALMSSLWLGYHS